MIYLITYDKNVLLKDYTPLRNAIKQSSIAWWHHMNNTWLITTNLNAHQIYNNLYEHISPQDRLLIIQIKRGADYQGWLNQEAWEWIKNQSVNAN